MTLFEEIARIIEDESRIPRRAQSGDSLFTDLAFDSLSFISLLLRIEKVFCIEFDIAQMEQCAYIDGLVELVKRKVADRVTRE